MGQLFCSGQRWISEAEPELGLGTLTAFDHRTLSIRFESSGCTRQYALRSAPLKRVIFKPGDQVQLKNHRYLTIETLSESGGLVYYSGKDTQVCEADLCDRISFSMPQDRLFAGIMDSSSLFDLRYRLLRAAAGYNASPAKGFLGGRVELIPHQFFIADEVTSRYIPRVLLSDETGLGKTIEACLILHKLLMTDRIKRVLVIVPESLVHQWFIELYRKFNLSFMIFSEDNTSPMHPDESGNNLFEEHQLGITGFDFLKTGNRQARIISAGWDMVVIDEAHHITDDNKIYEFIKRLAFKTFGLMLLTATPEQMGQKNHFLHLTLLDPERYFDFNTYLEETAHYQQAVKTIQTLIRQSKPVDHILDAYGPGRVIFRNTRSVIKGFPGRKARLIPLAGARARIVAVNNEFFKSDLLKTGETREFEFTQDPRISYLVTLIKQKKKILVICSSKEKALAVETAVGVHISVDIARFDETMSLIQRDRNAAWFSRTDGAQLLVCSEIGSEGRNFQFVHHLFLFDLPGNPELLEQRIGRLDRIGQKNDIQIHVPFILGTVYEVLAKWYMEALNLFEKNINGVHLIYQKFAQDLEDIFNRTARINGIDEPELTRLISRTKAFCITVDKKLSQEKNILLEMNSFKPGPARKIMDCITLTDRDKTLEKLLIQVLDHYGIEADFIDTTTFKLNSDTITDEHFPALTGLSRAMTFKRNIAIAGDDLDFFSWDHPFVRQTIDFFITNGTGSCSSAVMNGEGNQGILLETIFILECIAPGHLNLERYLMPDPIRIVVDHQGKDRTEENEFTSLSTKLMPDKGPWFKDMERVRQELIPDMLEKSRNIARSRTRTMIQQAKTRIEKTLGREIFRLIQLKQINPDIREAEIGLARDRMDALLDHLSSSRIRMDAIRLIRVQ